MWKVETEARLAADRCVPCSSFADAPSRQPWHRQHWKTQSLNNMNVNDIVSQIVRMQGLMPEVNRTTVALRFQAIITEAMKTMFGEDAEQTQKWINEDSTRFLEACRLSSPRAPIESDITAPSSILAQFIDKWESVNTWRLSNNDDWKTMCQETINVKATMLRDLREIINDATTAPGP